MREKIIIKKKPLISQLQNPSQTLLRRYRDKVFGNGGLVIFLEYELATFCFSNLSGGIGYFFRKIFYKRILGNVGTGVIWGKGISLRHPNNISFGNRVAVDDYVLLDAGGTGVGGIKIGDDVIISRNCVLQGKTGPVSIGDKTDIGCNTIISSVSGVFIDKTVLIAGNCYIGGGKYMSDSIEIPIMEQGLCPKGAVIIEEDVWLGAGVIVLDGVRIGKGSIIGAGAVVTKNLPNYSIATGIPATVVKNRKKISFK